MVALFYFLLPQIHLKRFTERKVVLLSSRWLSGHRLSAQRNQRKN